jgi:hypothetical protein
MASDMPSCASYLQLQSHLSYSLLSSTPLSTINHGRIMKSNYLSLMAIFTISIASANLAFSQGNHSNIKTMFTK